MYFLYSPLWLFVRSSIPFDFVSSYDRAHCAALDCDILPFDVWSLFALASGTGLMRGDSVEPVDDTERFEWEPIIFFLVHMCCPNLWLLDAFATYGSYATGSCARTNVFSSCWRILGCQKVRQLILIFIFPVQIILSSFRSVMSIGVCGYQFCRWKSVDVFWPCLLPEVDYLFYQMISLLKAHAIRECWFVPFATIEFKDSCSWHLKSWGDKIVDTRDKCICWICWTEWSGTSNVCQCVEDVHDWERFKYDSHSLFMELLSPVLIVCWTTFTEHNSIFRKLRQ